MIYIDIVFSMFLAAAISYMLLAALNLRDPLKFSNKKTP